MDGSAPDKTANPAAPRLVPVKPDYAARASVNAQQYEERYRLSIEDPDTFWRQEIGRLDWFKTPTRLNETSWDPDHLEVKWFADGELNLAHNCIDRHLPERANDVAIVWEGDNPAYHHSITYSQLHNHVCRFANELKSLGVTKGDRVIIYMPMIPEAAYAMLACARIGAVHSVVFGGFSPDALASRIEDCGARFVVTADEGVRGGKPIPLKVNVDKALAKAPKVDAVLCIRHTGAPVGWVEGRDHWHHDLALTVDAQCPAEPMNAEDPLFILYTSGSTGKPKGVLHTTGGYLLWTNLTFETIFDVQRGEVFWCTADVGWVTGHTYLLYGPLSSGVTTLMFEGIPTWPAADRFWRIVAKHKVNILYTAPTAIRALMREGEALVTKHDRSSLRLLGSVGEPINPEAWNWYYTVVGEERCPIVDTWWQTETGGCLITPLPGAHDLKPGAASKPMFGIQPALVDAEGQRIEGEGDLEGNLVLLGSWPGQMRTVHGDHQRFVDTYFTTYRGLYFTGDGARRDADHYWWITGRVDDVLNVSGHRLGTAEIESALVSHPLVAEAAVVGYPHEIKGQGVYCYVTLNAGLVPTDRTLQDLRQHVRNEIGPVATPDLIQFTPGLPKTRSGKIMRRILRKIAEDDFGALGDTSTLADPSVVDELIEGRMNRETVPG